MSDPPRTQATEALAGARFPYRVLSFEPPSSAQESVDRQGIELHELVRTIVVRRAADDYVFVLVPGGRQIDWPKLRSHLRVRKLSLPDAEEAKAATGYERGAITPFGAATAWPVVADRAVADLDVAAIGGGAHGVNVHLRGDDLIAALGADVANVTTVQAAQKE
jgi:Cys-tRNA(Pro)/Cys-tRNA(Cys) deacylase